MESANYRPDLRLLCKLVASASSAMTSSNIMTSASNPIFNNPRCLQILKSKVKTNFFILQKTHRLLIFYTKAQASNFWYVKQKVILGISLNITLPRYFFTFLSWVARLLRLVSAMEKPLLVRLAELFLFLIQLNWYLLLARFLEYLNLFTRFHQKHKGWFVNKFVHSF